MTDSKKATFSWNEKNTAAIASAYADSDKDNSLASLAKIAIAVGAKSAQSVRSKLTAEGVYVKSAKAASKGNTNKLTKIQVARKVAVNLGLASDALDTLDAGNMSALTALMLATTPKIEAA